MDSLSFLDVSSEPTSGAVQGQQAELHYNKEPDGLFFYKYSEEVEHFITCSSIIVLTPIYAEGPTNDHFLLYVETEPGETPDSGHESPPESRTYLRHLRISNPPSGLVEDFGPRETSCWQRATTQHPPKTGVNGDSGVAVAGVQPPANIHVVLSTGSGSRSARQVYQNLVKPFCEVLGPLGHKIHETSSPSSITELTRTVFLPAAQAGTKQFIILLSGDGGVVDVVNALLHDYDANAHSTFTRPTIALLPLGTGNALANSSLITRDSTLGMSSLVRGTPMPVPIFRAEFIPAARIVDPSNASSISTLTIAYGAVVFSWCLHAALVADSDTPAYRQHGAARFQMAAEANLAPRDANGAVLPPHAYQGTVSLRGTPSGAAEQITPDDTSWRVVSRQQHAYILATFCSHLEHTFCISPASRPLDGRLQIVHFGPPPAQGQEIMRLMGLAYDGGKHVWEDGVQYEHVEALRLEVSEDDEHWRRVCIDGTIFVLPQGGKVEVSAMSSATGAAMGVGVDLCCLRQQVP